MYRNSADLTQFSYKNITDIASKRVLLRACLNVTVDEQGNMKDATRYLEAMQLIKELAGNCKSLMVMGHLGRPEARVMGLSFRNNVYKQLVEDFKTINPEIRIELVENFELLNLADLNSKTVYLLDNIRFYPGEDSKIINEREEFARKLAYGADVFINDAFPDYRESASTLDVAKILPSYLGPKFLDEVIALAKFSNPERPFIAVLGGAKLSEKLDAMKAIAEIADKVLIGGAMAYTLMKAKGMEIGKSLYEEDKLQVAKEIINKFGDKIVLPVDHLVAKEFTEEAYHYYTEDEKIPGDMIAIDIGKKTIEMYKSEIAAAKSVLWNGPMGVSEWAHSEVGTRDVGFAITNNEAAFSLTGGGDSIAAINQFHLEGFDHISTGGGAMLAFLAYDRFPTLDAIVK